MGRALANALDGTPPLVRLRNGMRRSIFYLVIRIGEVLNSANSLKSVGSGPVKVPGNGQNQFLADEPADTCDQSPTRQRREQIIFADDAMSSALNRVGYPTLP